MRSACLACVLACLVSGCSRSAPPAPARARQAQEITPPQISASELAACCRQCLDASGRDPAGMDLAPVPCSKYRGEWNGAVGVSEPCAQLLDGSKATVGSCRARP